MKFILNGEARDFEDEIRLPGLLSRLGYETFDGMAVGVNQKVIPRDHWENYPLNDNDDITIIKAVHGG
jgi:sulfur carrier protein